MCQFTCLSSQESSLITNYQKLPISILVILWNDVILSVSVILIPSIMPWKGEVHLVEFLWEKNSFQRKLIITFWRSFEILDLEHKLILSVFQSSSKFVSQPKLSHGTIFQQINPFNLIFVVFFMSNISEKHLINQELRMI